MKLNQVAAQLYTLREYLDTPEKIPGTLKKVKEIGYPAVQVSGLCPIDPGELRKMLDDAGLVCCATHEDPMQILDNPQMVIDKLKILKCSYTAYPFPSNVPFDNHKSILAFAERLNQSGKIMREAGIILTYHNHHYEFQRAQGKLILKTLFAKTNPEYLQAELDTYWVQYGGGSPVEWCKKLKNRLPLLHMKDFRITGESKIDFAEIGNGNLNWKSIIKAAEKSGCQWFIVEQDTCPGDPFTSLQISLDYIRKKLAD